MNRDNVSPVLHPELDRKIRRAIVSTRFGMITLVVPDGRVVQLGKSEKIRLAGPTLVDGGGI
ncbi:MAG: DUF2292 domain-containing protein [Deltaproteobacteria bacterium]|nr:DUF2292 domain-containing protein [Deltaproteobacteria bacterium]